ncbi:MAG: TAXI family TRAP transporter solute-binding subunit [Synergistaceae bacterium]|jgi:TRAP transporter TAXI family solute receptor|nr:TAXI family TRAP transporter solute-binding subunit [Synergistaceae bacterium]
MKLRAILVLFLIFAMCGASDAGQAFVTIGSGGVGGTYYPLGGVMAELLSNGGVDIRANSRSTSASRENCRLVASDQAQIGMTMGSTLWQAYNGIEAFVEDGKLDLLTLMNMYPAPQHLVTTTRSGIKTFEDIRGKKVSVGAPGGGDQVLTNMILAAAGWNPEKDIQKQQLTQPEAVTALKDGNIDAAFFNFAVPGSAVMEIAAVRDVVLISLPDEVVAEVCKNNPFMMPSTIVSGTYAKQEVDVKTIADGNFLVVSSKMDPQVAYDCVKIFVEKREEIMKTTPQAADFVPEKASIGIIPFHPGAEKYLKEQGAEVKP